MGKRGPKLGWTAALHARVSKAETEVLHLRGSLGHERDVNAEYVSRLRDFNSLPLRKKLWFIITGGVV